MGRAPCCDKANVKRGPWSPEEDATLKSYIDQHGTGGNWISLPQKIGLKRCGKSCRLRWLNYLRPNIKHGGFSEEEDNIICNLYINIGSRWSIIAAQLPGRTDNDIKNYWNTRLKKKLVGNFKQHNKQVEALTFPNSLINKENKNCCFNVLYPPNAHELIMTTTPYWSEVVPINNPNYYPQQLPKNDQTACVKNLLLRFPDTTSTVDFQYPIDISSCGQWSRDHHEFGCNGSTSCQTHSQGIENLQAELNELIYSNPQVELDGSSEGTFYGFDHVMVNTAGNSSASADSGTSWGEINSSFVCPDPLLLSESCHETSYMLHDSSSFAFQENSNYFVQK